MRLFIAVEFPEYIREEIARVQNRMKKTQDKIKWVDPTSIHITLKFLGEVREERIEKILEVIEQTTGKVSPFTIEIEGTGAFPNITSPRVIWIGVKNVPSLDWLVTELESALEKEGFPREKRKWVPHLTVGRVKFLKERNKLRELILREKGSKIGKMEVKYVTLMQSYLTPKGPIYTPIKKFLLKGDKNERREAKGFGNSQTSDRASIW